MPATTVAPTTAAAGHDAAPARRSPTATRWPASRSPGSGVDEIVVAGVGVDDLKKGPGHYSQTPLPGEHGNAAIAGHRTTYGAPFLDIDNLKPGDEVVATTYAGRFVYKVTGTRRRAAVGVSVLDNTPDDRITLTSCDPKYSATNRIIVTAAFDAGRLVTDRGRPPATTAPPTTAPPDTSPDGPVVSAAVVTTPAARRPRRRRRRPRRRRQPAVAPSRA